MKEIGYPNITYVKRKKICYPNITYVKRKTRRKKSTQTIT